MYVAVKGGEKAIRAAHALQEQKRRGDGRLPELSVEQIGDQLSLAVDRVMTEGRDRRPRTGGAGAEAGQRR